MKTVDVFYVTYAKDAEWFRWSLKVLRQNLTGYRNIHVVCPVGDFKKFAPIVEGTGVIVHPIADWKGQGYFWQQWVKMNADQYTDADFIFHVDSDAFLSGTVDVQDFFVDGKPSWLWSYYSDFKDPVPWQEPTQKATGWECPQEFMQGFPFILRRDTYAEVRLELEGDWNISLEQYIRSEAEAGRKFSEFNVMGRIAFQLQQHLYHWVDRNRDLPWPAGFAHSRQFWSHAPLADHLPEIRNMLDGGTEQHIRTTDRGIWILSNDTHISQWVEKHHRLDFDGHLLPRILPHIKPGDTVVDVGAFIGDHTWAYAKAVLGERTDEGRVLAFEPNPMPFECLRRNMAGHGHVQCINKGLGLFPGTMGISQSPNVGASHLVAGDQVQITTLDSYGLTTCDLIKIDAEGHEFFILQGAWQTITQFRPVLVLEINIGALERVGVMVEDIYGWLKLRGYTVTGHEKNSPQFDVICLPK